MTDKRTSDLTAHWHNDAQNDADFAANTNVIELVRFLARRAAERDHRQHREEQQRKDCHD